MSLVRLLLTLAIALFSMLPIKYNCKVHKIFLIPKKFVKARLMTETKISRHRYLFTAKICRAYLR